MLNYARQFIKIRRRISETKPVTPNFYFISETSKSVSVRIRHLKKIYRVEIFALTSLN